MISFKQFLSEASVDSAENLANLTHEVAARLKEGEILKPDYEKLKGQVNRAIEKEADKISEKHTWGKGDELYKTGDHALADLSYAVPHDYLQILSLKNKFKKVKLVTHPFYKDLAKFYEAHHELAENLKALKDKIVTVTQKRAEKKEAEEKITKKAYTDSSSLVKVLEQHIDEYVAEAGKRAEDQYDHVMTELEKHDWNLEKFAPKPSAALRRAEYQSMNSKRAFIMSLTDGRGDEREKSPIKKKLFIDQAEAAAHSSYKAWVSKLIKKIGQPVEKAKMVGSPWTGSTLDVTCKDGSTQSWKTKMIINQSKYEKLFNQFPTRRLDKKDSLED